MNRPMIFGKMVVVPASKILEALGRSLHKIKDEDGLTWSDMARVMGKSDDMVAKYAEGTAEMGVSTFYFAKQAWNGRFTGTADRMVGDPHEADPHHAQSCILKAALALSVALEDGELTVAEIHASRSTLENARDAIDAQLARLAPKAISQ